MAITEVNAHLKYVNSSGDTTVIYPITKVDNVEGLNKFIDSTKGVVPISSGGTGASNAATARANLGAAPACTYGTADITVGRKSSAPNGTIHFVYATVDGAWDHVKSIFITVDGVWRLVWDITDGKSSYSIKTNLTGVTGASSNATTIPKNGIVELMFTPSTGYVLPENIVVVGADYIWDYIVGSLTLSNPTGDVIVTIEGVVAPETTPTTYSITTNLENVTVTQNSTYVDKDSNATLIFVADTGYTLPDTISVVGASHNWIKEYGELTIYDPTGNVTVTIVGVKQTYSIKTNLTGVTGASSNATTIPKNGIVELMFTPSTGYVLPENIVVVGADYIWDYIVGSLILSNPTGDVTVTIVGVLKTYSITTNLTGVTGRTLNPTTIAEDDTASLIFSASSGYTLPSTISVDGASYTWDGDSGALVLYSPTGNVTVTINGIETEPVVYSIFTNLTGVIGHALNPTTITENDAVSLEFDEKTGYEFPDSVSVTGAKYNWSNFGYLDLYDPTGNVTVTINGVLKTYSITTNLTGVTGDSSNLKVMAKDSSATLSFTAIIGYYLPDTVTVTGATYTWTKSTTTTGTLKLSNPTDDITIKIVGDAALVDL